MRPDLPPAIPPTPAQQLFGQALDLPAPELGAALRHVVEANVDLAALLDIPVDAAAEWSDAYRPPEAPPPIPDRDGLLQQLVADQPDPTTRAIASALLHHVDENGLLTHTIATIARAARTSDERVEHLRRRLRKLAPVGTGCRNRAEQMELRVRETWPDDPCFPVLVRRRLAALEAGMYAQAAASLGIEEEDVAEYARMLTSLPPRPPLAATRPGPAPTATYTITPDPSGFWRVVRAQGSPDPLRRQVVDLAILRQRAFLHHGPDHLRPFSLSDIARVLRRDLSTISRGMPGVVLHAKGVEIPVRTLFALPMVACDFTVAQLRSHLQRIIAQEDPRAPLPDAAIAELLTKQGLGITRRSVQKHRERLRIPAARDRRP